MTPERNDNCLECGHPWREHDTPDERKRRLVDGSIGCVHCIDDRGAPWAIEPWPCGCREIKPETKRSAR